MRRSWPACRGKLIDALIVVIASVPLDPMPAYLVARYFRVEGGPQIGVLDFAAFEVIPLPVGQPLVDTLLQILRVGVKLDVARLLERPQRFERGCQFHAIVGRIRRAVAQFALVFFAILVKQKHRAPAAWAGVW